MLQWYIRVLVDPSIIVLIIPREWHPLGAVARMGLAPSFLVIALRTANRHFWRRCRGLTIPSDCAKKCQHAGKVVALVCSHDAGEGKLAAVQIALIAEH
jgi:hypothetical protein